MVIDGLTVGNILVTSRRVIIIVKVTWQTVNVPQENAEMNPRNLTTMTQFRTKSTITVTSAGF